MTATTGCGPALAAATVAVLATLLLPTAAGAAEPEPSPEARRQAERLGDELALTPAERQALAATLDWLRQRKAELSERIRRGEVRRSQIGDEAGKIRAALVDRLEGSLPPARAAAVPVGDLMRFGPPLSIGPAVGFRHVFGQSLDRGPGRVSATSLSFEVEGLVPVIPPLTLFFGLGVTETLYDFDGADGLDPQRGEPVERVHGGQVQLGGELDLGGGWRVLGFGAVRFAVEDGADPLDGVTGFGLAGVSYEVASFLSLGLGVLVQTRLEDDARVFPVPLIELRADLADRLQLRLGMPEGLRLAFAASPALELSVGAGPGGALGISDVRLDDRGFAPDGVLRQQVLPVDLRAEWTPSRSFRATFAVGFLAYQKLEIDDRRGDALTEDRAHPAAFTTLSLSYRF